MDVKKLHGKPPGAVGKKRKKKEQTTPVKSQEKPKSKLQPVKTEVKTSRPIQDIKTSRPIQDSIKTTNSHSISSVSVTRKLEDQAISSSSGSSIDSHKPASQRQKRCSSDYDRRVISCSVSSNNSTQSTTSDNSKSSESSQQTHDMTTTTRATQAIDKKTSISMRLVDIGIQSDISVDTLRWEHELLDEELEKARIDEYKAKRRQRYIDAMTSSKEQSQLSPAIRTTKTNVDVHIK